MKNETKEKFLEFCKKEHFDISSETSKQREAVFSDEKYVIPAGAGSGKTTVLTYRFLRLLIDEDIAPIHSDEILTMTFTKAATANMKSRIYKALKVAESNGLIDKEEIDRFSNAEICTTDSFCSKIVRLDSIRYGITPDFNIEDDDEYEEWVENTVREIILEKIKDNDVNALVSWHGEEKLKDALSKVGQNYFSFPSPILSEEEMGSKLYSVFFNYTTSKIKEVGDRFETMAEEFINTFSKYDKAKKDIDIVTSALNGYKNNLPIQKEKFSNYKKVSDDENLDNKYTELKTQIKADIRELIILNKYLSSSDNYIKGWGILLSSFYRRLSDHKREKGALTFRDILLLSIDILKTNGDIRRTFSKRFKRIMVDEFQDNNGENKMLLYLLSSKDSFEGNREPTISDIDINKIFMVGDEKQSIYRFRGADVSVFKNIANDFGEDRVLSLSENFRSERTVINRINKMFQENIMASNPEEDYEARYLPLVSNVKKVSYSQLRFLWLDWFTESKNKDKKLKSDQHLTEAYGVAEFIKNEIMGKGEEWPVSKGRDGGERKPEYSDIAILLRKGSHQSDFEKALRHFNIPFNVSDNKSLTMDAVINDFYNVLQLVSYGYEDLLSLASFLSSPFASLSEDGVKSVIENIKEEREISSSLSPEDSLSLSFALETLLGAKEIAKKGRITPILTYLWLDRGYRFFIETKGDNKVYSEHYDYLFALASSFDNDGKSLIELLDRIRPLLGEVSDLKDISVQAETTSGVTIQTIHKSKGLEYPIVFISDTGGKSNQGGLQIHVKPDLENNPTIPFIYDDEEERFVNPWEKYLKNEEDSLENAETKRILYVAATRAEHHLIFTGAFDNEGDPNSTSKQKNLLYYIAKGLGFQFDYKRKPKKERVDYSCSFVDTEGIGKKWVFQEKEIFPVYMSVFKKEKKKQEDIKEEWYENPRVFDNREGTEKCGVTTFIEKEDFSSNLLPSSLYAPTSPLEKGVILPRLKIDDWLLETDDSLSEEEKKAKRDERIALFGTLVHKTLEDRIKGIEDDYSSFFNGEKGQKEAIKEALRLRDQFFASQFFTDKLKGFTLTPERSFMVKDGDTLVEGVIDLFAEKEDEIHIVDYKTDSMRVDSSHKNQLNYYKEAVKTMYPEKRIKASVFYLRDPDNVLEI